MFNKSRGRNIDKQIWVSLKVARGLKGETIAIKGNQRFNNDRQRIACVTRAGV